MRITYIHQYFNTPEMPGGSRSYEFARRLAADGNQVTVITSDRRPGQRRRSEELLPNLTVIWIPVRYENAFGAIRRLSAFVSYALRASLMSLRTPSDLVFATSTPLSVILPAWATRMIRNTPYVFEVRDLWPELPIAVGAIRNPFAIRIAELAERHAYLHAEAIVALSPGMSDGVRRVAPQSDVTIIPNSCMPEFDSAATTYAFPTERNVAVYAGTLGAINGLSYLVNVAEHLVHSNTAIVLLGTGKEETELKILATENGSIDRSVFFVKPVDKAVMPSVFASAIVALVTFAPLPEMESNSSNKFFDGLASGKPICLNYGGWHREVVEKSGAGLFMHGDPKVAARDLEAFINDPDRIEQASKAAGFLASEFSIQNHYEALRSVLMRSDRRAARLRGDKPKFSMRSVIDRLRPQADDSNRGTR